MTALDVPKYQRLIAPVGGWKKAINDIGKKTVSLIESTKNAGSEEKSFVDENFTETQKRQIMYKLGVSYNENFNTALLLDFADSIEKTNELFDRTTTNFILAENTSQTSQFYAIVKEIQDLERVINEGDKENNIPSLLDTLGKICEYQCVNKGNKGCR
ncbi:MAG: hypothetical protein LBD11_01090 [Candidatus Peribacteria bacterium]|jgi:hypothetical protein|nr:hypothetical protein [Candidatus Peribacteria bacterium]